MVGFTTNHLATCKAQVFFVLFSSSFCDVFPEYPKLSGMLRLSHLHSSLDVCASVTIMIVFVMILVAGSGFRGGDMEKGCDCYCGK